MNKKLPHKAGARILASMAGMALATSLCAPAMADESGTTENRSTHANPFLEISPQKQDKLGGDLANETGIVAVYVQFEGNGAYEQTQPAMVEKGLKKPVNRTAEVKKIRKNIKAKARGVVDDVNGRKLYVTTNTLPGVAVAAEAKVLRKLAKRDDVVQVTPIVPKKPGNKGTVIDTEALNTWTKRDVTGEGVKIAVLDTGVDYTHASFGGPGTVEAYKEAQASEQLPSDDSGLLDPDKFVGGWDLVGDSYNANPNMDSYQPVPHPDPNPLDCETAGHGSHVAGTAAGYGVNADGSTFEGDYSELSADEVNEMRIGPGSAPEAQLVGIRVFGCEGSSAVVGQALDYVLDPNGDGDFSDRADVVNMSLGSDFTPTDDPENDIVNELTKLGILSVVASGNAADVYDVGGAPGNARSALTVANSVGSRITLDRVDVLAPEDLAGQAAGQYSVNFDYAAATEEELTGDVVMAPEANRFGCEAFSDEAAARMDGKWVWIQWEENGEFPCGSAQRFNNAEAAGATGVVLDSPRSVFSAGIAGNSTIPGVQLNNAGSDKLRPAAEAGTLTLKLSPDYLGGISAPSDAKDTLNASSSRGVHGSNGVVKPDVAAPGTLIGSVAVASGDGVAVKSGTSMATPMVAGIAALVYSTGIENALTVKSMVMNTAVHDILSSDGVPFGPNRVGSGRVDALAAVDTDVYAYATKAEDLVSLAFGIVEAGSDPVSVTKSVTVQNTGSTARTYNVEYVPAVDTPGVSYSTPGTVTVPAQGSATVDVTMNINDPTALRHTLAPTMEEFQLDLRRAYLSEESGRLQLSAPSAPTLRVPVHSAPKPVADMSAGDELDFGTSLSTNVEFEGRDLLQGSFADGTLYNSLVGAFELGAQSGKIPSGSLAVPSSRRVDLQYVGAASNIPALRAANAPMTNATINFGVSTWQNWAAMTPSTNISVEIDVDDDGAADYLARTGMAAGLDLVLVFLYDADTGAQVGLQAMNGMLGNQAFQTEKTNPFDTNVMTLPVSVSALGLDPGDAKDISYRVVTNSYYSADDEGNSVPVDSTDWISYNPVTPDLWFGPGKFDAAGDLLFDDFEGNGVTAHRAEGVTDAKALFLHLHNNTGVIADSTNLYQSNALESAGGRDGGKAEVLPVSAEDEPVDETVDVRANAKSQGVNGTVHIAVHAVNQEDVPVDIRFVTDYGQRKFSNVEPGAAVYQQFDTGKTSVPAGEAQVNAYKRVDGQGYYSSYDVAYQALNLEPDFTPKPADRKDLKKDTEIDLGLDKEKFPRGASEVTLENLEAGEWVYIHLNDTGLGWHQASGDGTVTVTTPEGTKPGNNKIVVFDGEGELLGWDRIKVVGGPPARLKDK
ncbi:S8 family peptidase [Arthrobacter castelli]|uniref:S8 family peptidase n=1 Tax=Arthrobacter castelli TaxID=271431 RepID=UPI000409DC6F|nr:S8 family serine peptidase [Arthrobacter castelli]